VQSPARTPTRGRLDNSSLLRSAAFIGGAWREGDEHFIEVDDPFTGAAVGRVPSLNRHEIDRAIA